MGIIEGKTFKSGNSVAVRLPRELGFEVGTAVTIEKVGTTLTIKPVVNPEEEERALAEMIETIREIWKDAPYHPDRGHRDPIEFPDRPGL